MTPGDSSFFPSDPLSTTDEGLLVQFERIGFVRIEMATALLIEAYWGHR